MEQILFTRLPRIRREDCDRTCERIPGTDIPAPRDDPEARAHMIERLAPLGVCRWTEALGNGTFLLRSDEAAETLRQRLPTLLGQGENGLPLPFCLLDADALRAELDTLPASWREGDRSYALFPKEGFALETIETAVAMLSGQVRWTRGRWAVYTSLSGEQTEMNVFLLSQMLGRSVFARSPQRLQALLAEADAPG